MWFIPTKKEIKKEFDKIKNSFEKRDTDLSQALKERDVKIENHLNRIANIEGELLIIKAIVLNKSQSQAVSNSLKQSQAVSNKIETRVIQRIKQNKKAVVMAEIVKLLNSMAVVEAFDIIVKQKGLCSKASFYRYVDSLKSQSLLNGETERETSETIPISKKSNKSK